MDTCSFSLMKSFKCFSCLPQVSNTNVSTAPSNPPTPMPSTNVIASDGKQRYLRTERIVQPVRHAREVKVLAIQCFYIPVRARVFLGFPGSVLVTATCSWWWCRGNVGNPESVPLCPLQVSRGLIWNRAWVFAVSGRRPTSWVAEK
jgi:hypothetical protein